MYIFDTSSLRQMFGFYPKRFPSLWKKFDQIIECGNLVSVREVLREVEERGDDLTGWANDHKGLFHIPTPDEAIYVQRIFRVDHFQQSMEKKKQLKGGPFADPFLIAKAKVQQGMLVTEERHKPNGTKIPNICEHFDVRCTNLEGFMELEGWEF